jgi:DNA mismatch repair protein MutS
MLRQFYELKEQVGDAILFFRMGDFYEMFGDDATTVAPKLNLVLTSREKGSLSDERIPFCGVPHHSVKNYWIKLLKMGWKVAIADQVEDHKAAKGLVRREITKILTPGSIDDLDVLEVTEPNYILAAYENPKSKNWAVAYCDLSTREFRAGNLRKLEEIVELIQYLRPREVLVRNFYLDVLSKLLKLGQSEGDLLIQPIPEAILRSGKDQDEIIASAFGPMTLAEQPCGDLDGGMEVISAMLAYFKKNQVSFDCFNSVRSLYETDAMILDGTAMRDLEIFETAWRRESTGSLYKEINRTITPMGARLLKWNLKSPFIKQTRIEGRLKLVADLVQGPKSLLEKLRAALKDVGDVARLATKVAIMQTGSAELARLKQSLKSMLEISKLAKECPSLEPALRKFASCMEPFDLLDKVIVEAPSAVGTDLNVFKEGYDANFDEKRRLARDGEQEIERYESKLKTDTGISSLKIKQHKTFGCLIEVTRPNLPKVPPSFIRRQTMVNCERFSTIELHQLEEMLSSANQSALEIESALFRAFLEKFAKYATLLRECADALAELDVIQSFAGKAIESKYCMPKINATGQMEIVNSRHPVVESFVGAHDFVANSLNFDRHNKIMVVTGPNMGGKSTVMRQAAICVILNQIGSFVPAERADMPIFDRIFTRVGASDDLSQGKSTFMVEMSEAAKILRQATSQSFVILDEVGRGTSTQDGMALALAILEHLACEVKSYTMFSTHYHEIVPRIAEFPQITLTQTEVVNKEGRMIFTHRLIPGACGSSFGLEVSKMAGLPDHVIARAQHYIEQPVLGATVAGAPIPVLPLEKLGLQVDDPVNSKLRREISALQIDSLTPLDALNILSKLKRAVAFN